MEDGKPSGPKPYQRVYDDKSGLSELLENLNGSPRYVLNLIGASHSPPNISATLISDPDIVMLPDNTDRKYYIFDNPTFRIEKPDEAETSRTIPGYIRVDVVSDHTGTHIALVEFSNPEIHDAIVNPATLLNTTLPKIEPQRVTPNLDDTLSKNKKFKHLRKDMQTAKTKNPQFDKDKDRTLQTYTSLALEKTVRPYYSQEMLSLIDILLPPGITFTAHNKVTLSEEGKKITLRIELTELSLWNIKESKQYPLTGKLTLEYDFVKGKGFQFNCATSENVGLLTFFSRALLAPTVFTKAERIVETQNQAFISEPAKSISTEKELLTLLPKKEIVEKLLSDYSQPTTRPEQLAIDIPRGLVLDPKISSERIEVIRQYYRQSMLSLPVYICMAQSENLSLKTSKENTSSSIFMSGNSAQLTTTITDPVFIVRNPYDLDANPAYLTFKGNITVRYTLDPHQGFTLSNLTFSNHVLYNLVMNTNKIFPADDPTQDLRAAEEFRERVMYLQKAAEMQEKVNAPSVEASSPTLKH